MRHIRLITLAVLAIAPAIASAQAPLAPAVTNPAAMPSSGVVPMPTLPSGVPTLIPSPAVTQNTVTTTGPVKSETTISTGSIAGEVLTWIVAAFGVPIGGLLTAWLMRLFKIAGVQISDAARDRLQQIILNGLNVGAAKATTDLAGKGQVEIKDAAMAHAVAYVQAHGAETIKQLGLDPNSGAAVEAIRAHIETAIADPTVSTPAVLDPTAPPKPAAAA